MTSAASTMRGVYTRVKQSTRISVRLRVAAELLDVAVVRTTRSAAPVLRVPKETSAPVALVTGLDSPVRNNNKMTVLVPLHQGPTGFTNHDNTKSLQTLNFNVATMVR